MKIGKAAKKYGISKDNLYYYINYGLLVPPKSGTQYDFDEATQRDLETILELKDLDYSLADIHRILSLRRISGLDNPDDRRELLEMYTDQRERCNEKLRHLETVINKLDERILDLSYQTENKAKHTGLPLTMLNLLCCPHCGRPLKISDVSMDMKYIYEAELTCGCGGDGPGYRARVEDGILVTPNGYAGEQDKPDLTRELYKDLPPALISLFESAYNYMTADLRGMDLTGKVVMETYVNAWFFLHNHQRCFSPEGFYIVVDKFPETLRMYKDLIERESYDLPILYLADASKEYPLKPGCVDLHLDFFALNEHNFYSETFLPDELAPYMKPDAHFLGTYFYFDQGPRSLQAYLDAYPEASAANFSLDRFRRSMAEAGIRLAHEHFCGAATDSGSNLGLGFHQTGEKLCLEEYLGFYQS